MYVGGGTGCRLGRCWTITQTVHSLLLAGLFGRLLCAAVDDGCFSEPEVEEGAKGGAVGVHRLVRQQQRKQGHRGTPQPHLQHREAAWLQSAAGGQQHENKLHPLQTGRERGRRGGRQQGGGREAGKQHLEDGVAAALQEQIRMQQPALDSSSRCAPVRWAAGPAGASWAWHQSGWTSAPLL